MVLKNVCSREFGKPLRPFRVSDLQRLVAREWKGNIRKLALLIEQTVIHSEGATAWLIGASGAAELLALHQKTLYSRFEKLGLIMRYG